MAVPVVMAVIVAVMGVIVVGLGHGPMSHPAGTRSIGAAPARIPGGRRSSGGAQAGPDAIHGGSPSIRPAMASSIVVSSPDIPPIAVIRDRTTAAIFSSTVASA